MNKNLNYFLVVILLIAAGIFLSAKNDISESNNEEVKSSIQSTTNVESVQTVAIPSSLVFAEENVPLNELDVRERLDRELVVTKFYHSSTILFLKRANRWFPVIEPILKEQGVPDDFKYIAQSESGLENVVSPMNAVGFWQFRELAAKEQGLEVNEEIDERYHVEKSTVAACKYLKQLKEEFGSWTLAMAAYNYGPSKVEKQIERQGQNSYWDLLLPKETSRYVFRVIAFKLAYENPENFGFLLQEKELYPPLKYELLTIGEPVDSWKEFCEEKGITYKTLKWYNPWLREHYLKNTEGKEYHLKMPVL